MNEIIPPSKPGEEPPPPLPNRNYDVASSTPSKKLCTALGFLLFVLSGGLALVSPAFFWLGLTGAIISLFFPGYRCIFVGYISTIGVILLAVIVFCSTHPFHM